MVSHNSSINLIHNQSGAILFWVIASIVLCSSLLAGVVNITTSSRYNELMLNYNNRARFLSESGINYVQSFAEEIRTTTEVNTKRLSDYDGVKVNNLGTNEQISISIGTPDEDYNFPVTSVGTVNAGTSLEANYSLTCLVNSLPPPSSGVYVTENTPGVIIADDSGIDVKALKVNDFTGGISFDPTRTDSTVDTSKFSGAVGQFGKGIRVLFTFYFPSTTQADGFVFIIRNAALNSPSDIGGPRVGSHGGFIGYSGIGPEKAGNELGIRPPKFGLEFDTWNNGDYTECAYCDDNCAWFTNKKMTKVCSVDGRNDPNNAHISFLFWGNGYPITSNNKCDADDDNAHGVGFTPTNPSSFPGIISLTRSGGNNSSSLVGGNHTVRLEIDRSLTSDTSGDCKDKYKYTLKTWYNCTLEGCDDLSKDYTGSATLTSSICLTEEQHTYFKTFIYGYTTATGASTEDLTLSYPKIGLK